MANLFSKLLESFPNAYIGQGNPNAKILIIGKEHGFANDEQRVLEIEKNWCQWKQFTQGIDPTEFGYSPRYCYMERGQEFRIGGTSDTWFVYQEFINALIPHQMVDGERAKKLDFFDYSFITELSTINRPNNNNNSQIDFVKTDTSIKERVSLLSSEFFRSFPVVFLCCGKYFDKYHIDFEKMFDVKWEEPTRDVTLNNNRKVWYNVHYSSDHKRIVIHTWHAQAFCRMTKENRMKVISELTNVCVPFIK